MLIHNLPDGLRQLAEKRRDEYRAKHPDLYRKSTFNPKYDGAKLTWAFVFDQTPEGEMFWWNVCVGDVSGCNCRISNVQIKPHVIV